MNRNLLIGLFIIAAVVGYEYYKGPRARPLPQPEAQKEAGSAAAQPAAAGTAPRLEMSPAGGMPLLAQAAAKKDLEAARSALARQDYDAARHSFSRFLQTELNRYAESGPREVAEWYLKAKAGYDAAVDREMDRLVEGVRTGEVPIETAQMFARGYSDRAKKIEARLDDLKDELDRARARMAVGWVRVW